MNTSPALVSKERTFLFLSIIITLALLTGFPDNLKVFVVGTAGTITGGAVAVEPVEVKDYFIGLVIFAGLLVFLGYLVHALRTPRPQSWYPHMVDEDELSVGVDKNMPLENNLERVNKELKKLRTEKEAIAPKKKAKKLTKVPDIEEIHLEHTLRKINAQLHGYRKTPLVLEMPRNKTEWDDNLAQVKQELASVERMNFKKAKILHEAPSMKDIALKHESKKIQEELKRSLSKQKKPVTILEEPVAKKQWNVYLEKVNQDLKKVDQMPVQKVKMKTKMPMVTKTSLTLEQKKLAQELQKLHQTIEQEQQKSSAYFLKRHLPSSREWQLAKIKRHIQKKGAVKNKEELAEVERRLAEIYQEN